MVAHNAWDTLEVPDVGAWQPKLRVSVIVPFYATSAEHRDILERTLAGLSRQTYPRELFEVLVVDDGSAEPLQLPEGHLGLRLRALHQQRQGFGAPRARNLGAREADGDVLVFFDSDMIPEAWCVEAHARWHHAVDYAVTLGPRFHVEFDGAGEEGGHGVSARDIAGSQGPLAGVFAGFPARRPAWIDEHLQRTDQLTSAHHDLFRVVASGNLGVSRRLFETVGGFDEGFDQWGGEDTELGYRLFVAGGLLIHDEQATCWHQGEGNEPDADERLSLVEQRPKMGQTIAHHGFRRIRRGRTYQVPRVAVTVDATQVDAGAALSSIESVLASSLTDLLVHVELPADAQHARWLQRQFEFDARVVFDVDQVPWMTPYRMRLEAPVVVGMESIEQVLERLVDPQRPVGVVYATVPPAEPSEARFVAWSTRAVARVRLAQAGAADARDDLADHDAIDGRVGLAGHEDIDPGDGLAGHDAIDGRVGLAGHDDVEAAAEVFGRWWLSGSDVAIGEASTVNPLTDEAAAATAVAVRGELQALGEVLARLDPQQQRQLVATAKAGMTQLSARQLRFALRVGNRVMRLVARRGRRRRRG